MRSYDRSAELALPFISNYVREHGYPPSREEIAEHLGLAGRGAAQPIIERLRDRGLIKVNPGIPRGISITEAGAKALTEEL